MDDRSGPLDIALSPDDETARCYRTILRRIVDRFEEEKRGASGGAALVLSGSLALGEGASFRDEEGVVQPASDVDLYIVVPEKELPRWKARLGDIRGKMIDESGVRRLVIDLGVTSPERLERLTPGIANCVLSIGGKVIAGDDRLFARRRVIRCDAIEPWDGLLLLFNRTVEELSEMNLAPDEGRETRECWYRHGKTIRDLGASALAAAGRFTLQPGEREERLGRLIEKTSLGRKIPRFLEEYRFWCDRKERGAIDESAGWPIGMEDDTPARARRRKSRYVEAFWLWETETIFPGRRTRQHGAPFRGPERFRRRAAEWVRFTARRRGGGWAALASRAATGFPVTPATANYIAAVWLLLSWAPLDGGEPSQREETLLRRAWSLAPRRGRAGKDAGYFEKWCSLRRTVCEFWNAEIIGGGRAATELRKT